MVRLVPKDLLTYNRKVEQDPLPHHLRDVVTYSNTAAWIQNYLMECIRVPSKEVKALRKASTVCPKAGPPCEVMNQSCGAL